MLRGLGFEHVQTRGQYREVQFPVPAPSAQRALRGNVHQRREVQLRGVELPLELLDVALGIEEIQAILQRHQAITEVLAPYALGLLDGPLHHSSRKMREGRTTPRFRSMIEFLSFTRSLICRWTGLFSELQMQLCCRSQIIQLWFSPGLFGAYSVPLACHLF